MHIKTVLTAVAVVLMAFSPAIALDGPADRPPGYSYEDGRRDGAMLERSSHIDRPSPAQEKRDKQRFEWQKEDRSN
jgi:hypothetical protein